MLATLATGADVAPNEAKQRMRSYSPEFQAFVDMLLLGPTAAEAQSALAGRVWGALAATQSYAQFVEDDLTRELENGRMFRLVAKLNTVCERPMPHDQGARRGAHWAETGDRYVVKLFRDHVFHQVAAASGAPLVDLEHMVRELSLLDVGAPQSVTLESRDGRTLLVLSYGEIRRILERTLDELVAMKGA